MKSYLISTITDFIDAPIALVYDIVTDNSNFQWREEVKDIELLEEGFIEYYKALYQASTLVRGAKARK